MRLTIYITLIAFAFLLGCSVSPSDLCKGTYYERDSNGNLKKYNEHWNADQKSCLKDNLELSRWEKTSENWDKTGVTCKPQPQFTSVTMIAANNFYSYRDGKVYLDLDSATGIYRRLILSESDSGSPTFSRIQGCFYQRTGTGVDTSHGSQILLDTDTRKLITTEAFDPMEIFRYEDSGTNVSMIRFDNTSDWSYQFCPYLDTPWSFCEELRNGNDMYFPNLSGAVRTALTEEAVLIRKQFSFTKTSVSTFNSLWNNVTYSRAEISRDDVKYAVIHTVDAPRYTSQSWKNYIIGTVSVMPDITSSNMPLLCYQGSQTVTLANGSTGKIYGEICYDADGTYTFTQN